MVVNKAQEINNLEQKRKKEKISLCRNCESKSKSRIVRKVRIVQDLKIKSCESERKIANPIKNQERKTRKAQIRKIR